MAAYKAGTMNYLVGYPVKYIEEMASAPIELIASIMRVRVAVAEGKKKIILLF